MHGYHNSQGGLRAVENPIVVLWNTILEVPTSHEWVSQFTRWVSKFPIVVLWNTIMEVPTSHEWVSQFTRWVWSCTHSHSGFAESHFNSHQWILHFTCWVIKCHFYTMGCASFPIWMVINPIMGFVYISHYVGALSNGNPYKPTHNPSLGKWFTRWVSKLKVSHSGFVEYHYGSAFFPCMGITIHKVG